MFPQSINIDKQAEAAKVLLRESQLVCCLTSFKVLPRLKCEAG